MKDIPGTMLDGTYFTIRNRETIQYDRSNPEIIERRAMPIYRKRATTESTSPPGESKESPSFDLRALNALAFDMSARKSERPIAVDLPRGVPQLENTTADNPVVPVGGRHDETMQVELRELQVHVRRQQQQIEAQHQLQQTHQTLITELRNELTRSQRELDAQRKELADCKGQLASYKVTIASYRSCSCPEPVIEQLESPQADKTMLAGSCSHALSTHMPEELLELTGEDEPPAAPGPPEPKADHLLRSEARLASPSGIDMDSLHALAQRMSMRQANDLPVPPVPYDVPDPPQANAAPSAQYGQVGRVGRPAAVKPAGLPLPFHNNWARSRRRGVPSALPS